MNSYQQKTSDLVRNGESERAWKRHCGFLDLTTGEFMDIQRRLLQEQFAIAKNSRLWQTLFPDLIRSGTIDNFRSLVPLTEYALYDSLLKDKPEDILASPIKAWARTSGRGGQPKWVPFTDGAYSHLGQVSLGTHMLSAARWRGDVNVRPNDVVALNLPARPYLSGLAIAAMADLFDFRFLPRQDQSETMTFQERIAWVFQQAMVDGMDLLGGMTIVLVKMGEQFEKGANRPRQFSLKMLHPSLLWRFARARAKAKQEKRSHVLPRDLWQLKGLMCGGTDTAIYRQRIKNYWGVYPHETYGTTEAGLIASQAWDHQNMTFIPSSAFYEFIPEAEWASERLTGAPASHTVLLDELEAGKRYEVVLSNFYGGALLRYRMHDLIEVATLRNEDLGISLPQFRFVGRSGDFIDLSGFAGLIDEKQLIAALQQTGLGVVDWVVRKEIDKQQVFLCLYVELDSAKGSSGTPNAIATRLHEELARLNPEYANIEGMLGFMPVRATILPPGAFAGYTRYQLDHGADLAHMKPARIQPSPQALQVLLDQGSPQAAQQSVQRPTP